MLVINLGLFSTLGYVEESRFCDFSVPPMLEFLPLSLSMLTI